jgi:hypothetical protein
VTGPVPVRVLTRRDMDYFARSYAGGHDPADPRLSPIRAATLRGLAPATIVTAECDPLRDENEAFARMLSAVGVPVQSRRFDGQAHPFHLLGGVIDDANTARRWIGERLRAALGPAVIYLNPVSETLFTSAARRAGVRELADFVCSVQPGAAEDVAFDGGERAIDGAAGWQAGGLVEGEELEGVGVGAV